MGSHAADKHERLGRKWVCFSCQAKFYDLKKADPTCPRCGADPRQAPVEEPPKRARKSKKSPPDPAPATAKVVTLAPEPVADAEAGDEELDEPIGVDDDEIEELDLDDMDLSTREDEIEEEVA
jgi:uncharacterized protein (TIGR02300 family)